MLSTMKLFSDIMCVVVSVLGDWELVVVRNWIAMDAILPLGHPIGAMSMSCAQLQRPTIRQPLLYTEQKVW